MTISGERLDAVVADAVAGDREALRVVLETIRPIIVRYCRARIGSAERSGLSADDIAQEVCLAAITALPRYKDQGRPFLAFVYGIAAHKLADAHRASARNRAEPIAGEIPDGEAYEVGPVVFAGPGLRHRRARHADGGTAERGGRIPVIDPGELRDQSAPRFVPVLDGQPLPLPIDLEQPARVSEQVRFRLGERVNLDPPLDSVSARDFAEADDSIGFGAHGFDARRARKPSSPAAPDTA